LLEPRRHPTVAPVDSVAPASRLYGISILEVDDIEACDALTKVLGSLGAKISAATSAQAALARLAGTRPDAIVADIGTACQPWVADVLVARGVAVVVEPG